ncbi:MAG TPA: hypothetical protein VGV59_18890 [Pyrinomonadaceae bacterium]|nr:hypothetical protein [Pyrinomonadaceae bacterium]
MNEKDFSEDERDAPEASATGGGEAAQESHGLAYTQARLAYSIINALLEHTRVTSDLVALMAQVLGEETARALTQTPHWSAYLDSRRTLERTRQEIEQFAEVWTQLAGDEPPPRP